MESKFQPVKIENANERQRPLLEKTKATYKTIPAMQMIMANYPPLLQSYLDGMEQFRKESGFSPVEQEIIFMVISRTNECYPCLIAHGLIAEHFSGISVETINLVKSGNLLNDEKLNVLIEFTTSLVKKKGFVGNDDISRFITAGYSEIHILALIHALSLKLMSNYTNHIFQHEMSEKAKLAILKNN